MRLISASRIIQKSHIYIVTVLANLNTSCDDSDLDEPLSLKEVMRSLYWKNFEKAMYAEFQSLIENNIWKYRDMPIGWAILTGRWVFKIKKNKWSKILKFKTQ